MVKRLAKCVNRFENFIDVDLSGLFLCNQLCSSPLSSMPAAARMSTAAGMRRSTTYSSTLTITMHVASPVITAAKKK
jgi:hypothetical protein